LTRQIHRIVFIGSLLWALSAAAGDRPDLVKNGVADLRNAEMNQTMALDGEWRFAWQRALGPTEKFPADLARVPGRWSENRQPGIGFASYRLKILLPENHPPMALHFPEIHSAWRLWIDGDPMANSGIFGVTPEREKPGRGTRLCELPGGSQIDLVWQVSNFSHFTAGPARSIRIGSFEQLHHELVLQEVLLLLCGGVFLVLAGYQFSLGIRPGAYRVHAWFALPSGLLGAQLLLSSNGVDALIPGLSAPAWFRAEQLGYIWFIPAYAGFLRQVYPRHFARLAMHGVWFLAMMATVATLSLSVLQNEQYRWWYWAAAILPMLYVVHGLCRAWAAPYPEAGKLLLVGFALLLIAAIDALATTFELHWRIYHYAALPWAMVHSVVLSRLCRRRAQAEQSMLSGHFMGDIHRETSQLAAKVNALEATLQDASANGRARDALMAALGHDLRAPMNGVLGAAQALKLSGLQGESRDLVELIMHSGRNMNAMLGELLDLCRGGALSIEIKRTWFDLPRLLENTLALVRAQARRKGLKLTLVPVNVPTELYADEVRLQEVLLNLLGNAIKYTRRGGVTLKVEFPENSHAGEFQIEVSDSGRPISQAVRTRIFEPFYRGKYAVRAAKTDGLGLGLYICKTLVEKMGGRIALSDAGEQGNCFRVCLPFDTALSGTAGDALQDPSGCTLMLVDDEALNHTVMQSLCHRLGYTLVSASSAEEAMTKLDHSLDLILIDIYLPGMNGVELAAAIRARPEWVPGKPRMVMCSGCELPPALAHGARYFDDRLPKPILYDDFRRLVRRIHVHHTDPGRATLRQIHGDLGQQACSEIIRQARCSLESAMGELQADAPRLGGKSLTAVLHRVRSTAATLGLSELERVVTGFPLAGGQELETVRQHIQLALAGLDQSLSP